jgi:hypothetical protein
LEVRNRGDGHPPFTEREREIHLNGTCGVKISKPGSRFDPGFLSIEKNMREDPTPGLMAIEVNRRYPPDFQVAAVHRTAMFLCNHNFD